MALRCSVVIPVWNPGPNLRRCLDSLLTQTMARTDYEIICVDDGSTDGTAGRLDDLAAAHPGLVRVLHISHSGWPGRPRNVGIDAARAPYVHLVDNDDTLPPYALADLHAAAMATGADVVLGRPASDFRGLNHSIYRRDIVGGTLADHPELAETLTPHKMFRRELLQRHGIRFPDGPTPLEDQFFVLQAYLHARAITLLTDRPYYSYLRRVGSGRNAGDAPVDPIALCRSVAKLLDIVTAATDDVILRDRLFRRAYRVVLLPRLGGRSFLDADPAAQRTLLDAVRSVVTTRLGPRVHRDSGAAHRMVGRLVLDDDLPGVVALAEEFAHVTLHAPAAAAHWVGGALRLRIDGMVRWRGRPLVCDPVSPAADSRANAPGRWALPAALMPTSPVAERLIGTGADSADAEVSVVDRATGLSFGITEGVRVHIDDAGRVRVGGTVDIDAGLAAAGAPLTDGVWDVRLRMRFEGWHRIATVHLDRDRPPAPLLGEGGRTVWPHRSNGRGALALDVNQWIRAVADQVGPTCLLTALGTTDLELTIGAEVAGCAEAELLLEPDSGTTTGVIVCSGQLRARGHAARATLAVPDDPADGTWRAWLRVRGLAAVAPSALPWRIRRSAGRLTVQRVEASADGSPG